MNNVCVVTSTRADYGILSPLIRRFENAEDIELRLVVTGAHLSHRYGMTVQEIRRDGIPVDAELDILSENDSPVGMSCSMARMLQSFSAYLDRRRPDMAILLGDRYENFAAAAALVNAQIPIAHLHGGELTQGAVDDCYRHSITKMSYLHFPSTEAYRQRILRLGESPGRVYAYGALGVENIRRTALMDRKELGASVGADLSKPFAVVTFHPVTLEPDDMERQCKAVFSALEQAEGGLFYLITKSNADAGGQRINALVDQFAARNPTRCKAVSSLGMKRYLSALRFATMVIGNSSSGIIEAPSFHIPTINIGSRQQGRIQAASTLNCPPEKEAVLEAMRRARSDAIQAICRAAENPYEGAHTSKRMFETIRDWLKQSKLDLKKDFYEGA